MRLCEICGYAFIPTEIIEGTQKTCGQICRDEASRRRAKARGKRIRDENRGKAIETVVEQTQTCLQCNKEYHPSKYMYHRQKFCTPECYAESRRVQADCKICGETFTKTPKRVNTCSEACRLKNKIELAKKDYEKKRKKNVLPKNCRGCKKVFTPSLKFKEYCSQKCKKHSYKEMKKLRHPKKLGVVLTCPQCLDPFTCTHNTQKYCSEACQVKFHKERERERRAARLQPIICKNCFKEFQPAEGRVRLMDYCGIQCRDEAKSYQYAAQKRKKAERRALIEAQKVPVQCRLEECENEFIPKSREHKFCCKEHLRAHYRATAETKLIERIAKPLPDCLDCGKKVKTHFKRYCEACFGIRRGKQKNGYVPETEIESVFDIDSGDFYRSPWAVIGDRCKLDRTPSELDPADSEFADEISAFLKKGGEIKKLPVGFCTSPIFISGAGVH